MLVATVYASPPQETSGETVQSCSLVSPPQVIRTTVVTTKRVAVSYSREFINAQSRGTNTIVS